MTQRKPNKVTKFSCPTLIYSIGLYIFSLNIAAFKIENWTTHPPHETLNGGITLILGVFMGWFSGIGGFSAYSNLFYLYIIFKMFCGKLPKKATIYMVFLFSLVFLFKGTPVLHSGGISPVLSWGWGAILWGLSIITLALTVLIKHLNLNMYKGYITIALANLFVLLPVIYLNYQQNQIASERERQLFLNKEIAFTLVKLSNTPNEKFILNKNIERREGELHTTQ